jgi:hypothetical protein
VTVNLTRRIRTIPKVWALVAGLAAAQCVLHLVNATVLGGGAFWLDADADGNAFTWASAGLTMAAGAAAALLGVARPTRSIPLVLTGVVLAFLAVDDLLAIHEEIGFHATAAAGLPGEAVRIVWPIVYLPLLVFAAVVLWRTSRRSAEGPLVTIGLALLATAILAEVGSSVIAEWLSKGSILYAIEVAIEEAVELAGWATIAIALGRSYVRSRRHVAEVEFADGGRSGQRELGQAA